MAALSFLTAGKSTFLNSHFYLSVLSSVLRLLKVWLLLWIKWVSMDIET